MKTIELFQKISFDDLYSDFTHLLEYNNHKKLTNDELQICRKLYSTWRSEIIPKPSNYIIDLGSRWEHCSPCIDMNCVVSNKYGDLLGPVAMHPLKEEILGMEIIIDKDVRITDTELAAGLFYEMTYYGINVE